MSFVALKGKHTNGCHEVTILVTPEIAKKMKPNTHIWVPIIRDWHRPEPTYIELVMEWPDPHDR